MTEKLAKRGIPAQTMIRLPQVMEMVGLGKTPIFLRWRLPPFGRLA